MLPIAKKMQRLLKLDKEQHSGMNEVMKNVVSYNYFEVVIDKDGLIGH